MNGDPIPTVDSPARLDIITGLLMLHRKEHDDAHDLVCSCGYRYTPGENIHEHRARVIDAALFAR